VSSARRVQERGGGDAMSLAMWTAGHASVGVGGAPLADVLCLLGVTSCPRDSPMEAVVVVCGGKSCPNWLLPAMEMLTGATFLLGDVAIESSPPIHQSGVKTRIWLAGLDDSSVF
jgi:hypothetical protein